MEFRLLPLDERHLSACAALECALFSEPWSEAALRSGLESPAGVFLAAETADGVFAGYAGMQAAADEGYVANIAVEPRFQRRGCGRLLTQGLIQAARDAGCRFLSLEVRVSNGAAVALYQSLGFETMGVRRGFYQKPAEDAAIMTLFFDRDGQTIDDGKAGSV